jgi:hypothetical protein
MADRVLPRQQRGIHAKSAESVLHVARPAKCQSMPSLLEVVWRGLIGRRVCVA